MSFCISSFSMNQEKIFAIIVIGLVAGGISIALAGSNYFEELANSDAKGASSILIDGYNIGNFSTNEALTQRFFIEGMKKSYDVAVFGSSRIMQIYNHNFPYMTLVNHGISGGNTEDMIAYTQMYHERNKLPAIVIIGADPWTVQNRTPKQGLEEAYLLGVQNMDIEPDTKERTYDINIKTYFQKLDIIRYGLRLNNLRVLLGYPNYYATNERFGVSTFKLIDGYSYPLDYLEKTREENYVNALAIERKIDSYGIPIPFNPEDVKRFEIYIHYMLNGNLRKPWYKLPSSTGRVMPSHISA